MTRDEILHRRRGAAIRHVHDGGAGRLLELLADDMAGAAVPLRCIGQLARVGLGVGNQLPHRVGRHGRVDDQHVGGRRDQANGSEILLRVIGQIGHQMRQDGLRLMKSDIERVAVGRRLGHGSSRNRAGATGAILDHGRLAGLAQLLRQRPAHEIGNAAWRCRDDQLDRLRRIGLCLCGCCEQTDEASDCCNNPDRRLAHGTSPSGVSITKPSTLPHPSRFILKPARRTTPSRASCASRSTRGKSTPTRLPRHFFTLPAMSTVSTFIGFIRFTTAPAALLSGQTLIRSAANSTTSASLPGVSVPTLLSRLVQREPSTVANSSTSRVVRSGGRFCSPLRARCSTLSRCSVNAARITVNGSCAMVTSTSEESDGRTPWSSASWIGGMPWPIAISIGTASETWPPLSLIRRQASLLRCVQWMYSSPGFISPARPSSSRVGSVLLLTPCETMRTPISRAMVNSRRSRPTPSASVSN